MRVIEMQSTYDYKGVIKYEMEASAKVLRIENLPNDKEEVIYTLTAELLAPILNTTKIYSRN